MARCSFPFVVAGPVDGVDLSSRCGFEAGGVSSSEDSGVVSKHSAAVWGDVPSAALSARYRAFGAFGDDDRGCDGVGLWCGL